MSKVKKCVICGKEFVARTYKQKTCSNECRKVYKKEYSEIYRKQNKDKIKLYHAQLYKAKKKPIIKICTICKKEFILKASRQKYCCNKCYKKAKNISSSLWYKKNKSKKFIEKNCPLCGNKFMPKHHNQKYCSKECATEQILKNYKTYRKTYEQKHRGKISKDKKEWYNKNKDKINENARLRMKMDFNFKIKKWCRRTIRRCLVSKKDKHTFDILKYTPQQLKQRLEMNFKPDMNWGNYGVLWNIDHIKPLCKFNFIKDNDTPDYHQIFLANCLANLQPLYCSDNFSKSSKFTL